MTTSTFAPHYGIPASIRTVYDALSAIPAHEFVPGADRLEATTMTMGISILVEFEHGKSKHCLHIGSHEKDGVIIKFGKSLNPFSVRDNNSTYKYFDADELSAAVGFAKKCITEYYADSCPEPKTVRLEDYTDLNANENALKNKALKAIEVAKESYSTSNCFKELDGVYTYQSSLGNVWIEKEENKKTYSLEIKHYKKITGIRTLRDTKILAEELTIETFRARDTIQTKYEEEGAIMFYSDKIAARAVDGVAEIIELDDYNIPTGNWSSETFVKDAVKHRVYSLLGLKRYYMYRGDIYELIEGEILKQGATEVFWSNSPEGWSDIALCYI